LFFTALKKKKNINENKGKFYESATVARIVEQKVVENWFGGI
jgi:hypothetical protein